ncbi:unnamed protein product [Alopecurus aequalis]
MEATAGAGDGGMEVVVFPWLAFGHMIPLPPVPPHLSARLRFISLPLPTVDGLPEGAESTADVPAEKIELLKRAMDGLAAPLDAFLADEYNVPCAAFLIVHAGFVAFLGPREAEWLVGAFRANASGVSDMDRVWGMFERCHLTIYRSCEEVDPGMFALLTELIGKPAVPAGVLLPPVAAAADDGRDEVLRWLDEQPPKSVIYVALGSEAPLTLKNLHELALGLELTERRRAARRVRGATGERTRGRGMVQTGWVPQVASLAHGATGGFLTHCGWGSTVESFASGLPLVMIPFIIDQPLVARAMEEKGIGVEVERYDTDGLFDRDGVAAAVRRVMLDEEGKVLASNARKLKEVLADQAAQERYIDDLVENLRRH